MTCKIIHVVILGAPAAGKGTIAKRIVAKMGFVHIPVGDILRQHIANITELGRKIKDYTLKGQLVPDDLMIQPILQHIKTIGSKSWILDGFPRTLTQAQRLCQYEKIHIVFKLRVPHDLIMERVQGRRIHLASGRVYNLQFKKPKVPGKDDVTGEALIRREDDKPEIVLKRLKDYEEIIQPVVSFYEKQNLIKYINGGKDADVWGQVETCLKQKINDS